MSARGAVATVGEFARNGLGVPVLVMVVLAMMVLPLPAFLLDIFFTFNISLSLMILLAVIYVRRALEFAPVTEVNRHLGDGPYSFPVEDEMIAKIIGYLSISVEGGPEESTVGATEFVVEIPKQAQRKYRFAACECRGPGLLEIREPIEL